MQTELMKTEPNLPSLKYKLEIDNTPLKNLKIKGYIINTWSFGSYFSPYKYIMKIRVPYYYLNAPDNALRYYIGHKLVELDLSNKNPFVFFCSFIPLFGIPFRDYIERSVDKELKERGYETFYNDHIKYYKQLGFERVRVTGHK
jgi:hypothetical protein